MPDGAIDAAVAVIRAGRPALGILRVGGVGRVEAVFERSFYVAFDHGRVCLGPAPLPMGPLNVRLPAGLPFPQLGDSVLSAPGRLRIGHLPEFTTRGAVPWDPPSPPPWSVYTARKGLAAFDRLAGPGGVGTFEGRAGAAVRPAVGVLVRALEGAFRDGVPAPIELDGAVTSLLGLGPGLTPSGDDFLCGMLIALDILGAAGLRDRLRAVIERAGPARTHAISLSHLRAAGAGAGHEALHDCLNSLLAGDAPALPGWLAAIDRIGGTSGRDALAGICVTLRAFLACMDSSSRGT